MCILCSPDYPKHHLEQFEVLDEKYTDRSRDRSNKWVNQN